MTQLLIDHTTDDSAELPIPAAAPKARVHHARERFSGRKAQTETVSATDLRSRAAAAARLMLRGDRYSTEDRVDAASHAVEGTLARMAAAPSAASRTRGRPADVLKWIARQELIGASLVGGERVPAELASMTRLTNLVATFKRTLDRDRDRDLQDANRTAAAAFAPVSPEAEIYQRATRPDLLGTAKGARLTAAYMLRDCGLPTEHGPMFTLAYASARTADGLDAADIAGELELEVPAYRQHLSRAAGRLRSGPHSAAQWADALHTLDMGGIAKPHSAGLERGWRGYDSPALDPVLGAPDSARPVAPVAARTLKPTPKRGPAAWTRTTLPDGRKVSALPPNTEARLRRASELRQAGEGFNRHRIAR